MLLMLMILLYMTLLMMHLYLRLLIQDIVQKLCPRMTHQIVGRFPMFCLPGLLGVFHREGMIQTMRRNDRDILLGLLVKGTYRRVLLLSILLCMVPNFLLQLKRLLRLITGE